MINVNGGRLVRIAKIDSNISHIKDESDIYKVNQDQVLIVNENEIKHISKSTNGFYRTKLSSGDLIASYSQPYVCYGDRNLWLFTGTIQIKD